MKIKTNKLRKILRAFYLFVGAGVVSVIFTACYGGPPRYPYNDYDYDIDHTTEEQTETETSEDEQ